MDGPRQSGKTTLSKAAFPDKAYVTLEPLDTRDFARSDPRGFLSQHRGGAIIDDIQHAPDLLSYLQDDVDRDPAPGRFILTGSQNFAISQAVSQSLAGRAGILHLLPFSRAELASFPNAPKDLFLCCRLPAWHRNLRKQIVKAPKLHFFDTGLVCHLLGIQEPAQLRHHPLRGAIFETWVFSELYKQKIHRGETPQWFHFRESRGIEVDFIEPRTDRIVMVEAKSGETIASDSFEPMQALEKLLADKSANASIEKQLVYGGNEAAVRSGVRVVPWHEL